MSSPSTSSSSDTVTCDVNETYFHHLFLIPAAIILIVLAFLRRRRSFKKYVWGGRPGLVVPIDFLGIDHDRLSIMFVFGAAAGSIMNLIISSVSGRNAWETGTLNSWSSEIIAHEPDPNSMPPVILSDDSSKHFFKAC